MRFITRNGFKGEIKLEGMLWFKKWRAYLWIENSSIIIETFPGEWTKDKVKQAMKIKYPEIKFE
jgi:hypothetical protein